LVCIGNLQPADNAQTIDRKLHKSLNGTLILLSKIFSSYLLRDHCFAQAEHFVQSAFLHAPKGHTGALSHPVPILHTNCCVEAVTEVSLLLTIHCHRETAAEGFLVFVASHVISVSVSLDISSTSLVAFMFSVVSESLIDAPPNEKPTFIDTERVLVIVWEDEVSLVDFVPTVIFLLIKPLPEPTFFHEPTAGPDGLNYILKEEYTSFYRFTHSGSLPSILFAEPSTTKGFPMKPSSV